VRRKTENIVLPECLVEQTRKRMGEIDTDRIVSSCVNRTMAPANVSTPMNSSSESELGPGGSQ